MKVCVFGAGAIGGNLAARLAEAKGAQVSVVARGDHLAAIRTNGITVETAQRSFTARVTASADPRELGPQDLVIVTVKAPALPEVAATIGPLLQSDTPVMFVMNGIPWWYFYAHGGEHDGKRLPAIDPDDAVWNAVGPQRAIGSVVYSANAVVRPGVISNANDRMHLIVGEPNGTRSKRIEDIAAFVNSGSATAKISERIRDDVWTKLLANMASNPLTFLAQATLGDMLSQPVCVEAVRTIAQEGSDIARAFGCNATLDIEKTFSASSRHKPSIVQDLERGKPLELAAMFTVPAEFGKLAGVKTPMLDLMVALMLLRAKSAGLA